ncbi:hypothetical protein JTE90_028356 [Oedothorax gibbosus]|uniref:J domain-containing protein n=1 Tax=Oedothorax gibbosus TaxID=931172 RepID=A0AAV6U141_9ARAC|nr:hypothetical protein JTE90_028356 [Oedothorax gibbosus]
MGVSELKLLRFYNFNKQIKPLKFQITSRYLSDNASSNPKTNLYETLGLNSTATSGEIKKAYYDLSFKYHPDRNENNVDASNKFREVTEAYEILGNYGLKKRYDKGLPLPLSKQKSATLRPVKEINIPLQKFYDSRQSKSSAYWRVEDEEVKRPKESDFERKNRKFDEDFESSKSIRGFLAAVTIVFFLTYKFYSP